MLLVVSMFMLVGLHRVATGLTVLSEWGRAKELTEAQAWSALGLDENGRKILSTRNTLVIPYFQRVHPITECLQHRKHARRSGSGPGHV